MDVATVPSSQMYYENYEFSRYMLELQLLPSVTYN